MPHCILTASDFVF